MTDACPARDKTINYIEFLVTDITRTKAFYDAAFGWTYTDYGPSYCEFNDGHMKGGFEVGTPTPSGGALVVLYAEDLEACQASVEAAGGAIVKPVFEFPGGRRFHFTDPDGYELAVWTVTGT